MIINNNTLVPFTWIDFQINDFVQFQEALASWEIDFVQLDGGTFHSEIQHMIIPEVNVGHTHFDCHLDQKGKSPDNMWSFVIMEEDASMYQFHHTMTKSTSTMVVYTPGSEINGVSFPGFNVYVLSVTCEHLTHLMQILGLEKAEEKLLKIDRIELEPEQAEGLRELLKGILRRADVQVNKVITQEERKVILEFLPVKFLKEIATHIGCAKEKIVKEKHFLYLEVRAYMHTHLDAHIGIEQIARKFGISERTLRNYFKEELHTSPKEYLTVLRLTKVKDELKLLEPESGIVERTARKFGFTHMGQFSKAYKDFFGELPSETLHRESIVL